MKLYEKFPIYIFNTLTGKKEQFTPINPGFVGMYVCGPTVYSDVHLGNIRTFLSFDIIARYFRHVGYKLRYVRNITDVGHLESDHDGGEDKILKRARLEQLEPMEVAQRYMDRFHYAMQKFNIQPPSIEPSATGHIIDQIQIIQRLLDAGFAYEINGSVYFHIEQFNLQYQYGVLSGKVIEELATSGRSLDRQDEKRNAVDFALWKKASSRHIMRWPSPWGDGFPGWHIECTAMSTKYLGKTFDIHGGGMDLKFPHHECEMAQSLGALGCQPARYWMHTNMLTVNGQKMSKSLGNVLLPEELLSGQHALLDRGFDAMTIRFFILQSHYSSILDFSSKALTAAEKGYNKLKDTAVWLNRLSHSGTEKIINNDLQDGLNRLMDEVYKNMSDDFNTAKTIATLFDISGVINRHKRNLEKYLDKDTFGRLKSTYLAFLQDVLGLCEELSVQHDLLSDVIHILVNLRDQARRDRDFSLSDKIREDLKKAGIQLQDGQIGDADYTISY